MQTFVKLSKLRFPVLLSCSPWASCCVWCRTAGVWGCSPCCGRPAAGSFSGTSAWLEPLGRRWPEPPPEDPSPPSGVLETRRARLHGDVWCVWRPLPPPRPTCRVNTKKSRLFIHHCRQTVKSWCNSQKPSAKERKNNKTTSPWPHKLLNSWESIKNKISQCPFNTSHLVRKAQQKLFFLIHKDSTSLSARSKLLQKQQRE